MSYLNGMNISASALTAQRTRMDVIAENMANIDTTRTPEGTPYAKKSVILEEKNSKFAQILERSAGREVEGGVRISEITEDTQNFKLVYDPVHPDADEAGYVRMPNVDANEEMVNMLSAYRSYEANVTVFNTYKDLAVKTFEISG